MGAPPLETSLFGARVLHQPFALAIPEPLIENRSARHELIADQHRATLRVDGVAAFAVDRGRQVLVDADPAATRAEVAQYLNGTVTALVLGQQGRFALHANAVAPGTAVVLVAGKRGAGKSTTSLRMLQRGHAHLSDDLCVLHVAGAGVVVAPTARGIRFLPSTAAQLGFDPAGAVRAPLETEKLVLPRPQPVEHGHAVAAVVVLEPSEATAVDVRRVSGAEALRRLTEQVYRRPLVQVLWGRELFDWTVQVAERVPVYVLRRPASAWTVDEVADAIERLEASPAR